MDIRKLQRVIVDGLEDVKAQNIVVFNTEHLSPLFERVIVASGTSNRQTKALAASVRDAVKSAGVEPSPRTEGEDNGEWIIVDCGAAVVHVMQPAIRDYYHLEELWGDKPVTMKIARAPGRAWSRLAPPTPRTTRRSAPGRRRSARTRARRKARRPAARRGRAGASAGRASAPARPRAPLPRGRGRKPAGAARRRTVGAKSAAKTRAGRRAEGAGRAGEEGRGAASSRRRRRDGPPPRRRARSAPQRYAPARATALARCAAREARSWSPSARSRPPGPRPPSTNTPSASRPSCASSSRRSRPSRATRARRRRS